MLEPLRPAEPNLLNLAELDFAGSYETRYRIERLDTRTELRFHFQLDTVLSTAHPRVYRTYRLARRARRLNPFSDSDGIYVFPFGRL